MRGGNRFEAIRSAVFSYTSLLIIVFMMIATIIAFMGLSSYEIFLRDGMGGALETIRDSTVESYHVWLSQRIHTSHLITRDTEVVALTEALLAIEHDRETLLISDELGMFRSYFEPVLAHSWSGEIYLITTDGLNIASMGDASLADLNPVVGDEHRFFERALAGESIFAPLLLSDVALNKEEVAIFVLTPVHDETGTVIALLSIGVDIDEISEIAAPGRIGESGETYVFTHHGMMLSQSRFTDQLYQNGLLSEGENSVNNIHIADPGRNLLTTQGKITPHDWPLTLAVNNAVQGESGSNVEGYNDYRGVKVFGAWTWIDELDLGVVTEIDEGEILLLVMAPRLIVLAIGGIIFILVIILAFLLQRSRQKAIEQLVRSNQKLEERVAKRTKQLRESNDRYIKELEVAADGIIIANEQYQITFFNESAELIFGYTAEELIGQLIHKLLPMRFQQGHMKHMQYFVDQPQPSMRMSHRLNDIIGLTKDGIEFPADISISKITSSDGLIFTLVVQDVTERIVMEEALRESEEHFRALFEDSPMPLLEADYSQIKLRLDKLKRDGVQDIHQYLNTHPAILQELVTMRKYVNVNRSLLRMTGTDSVEQYIQNAQDGTFESKSALDTWKQTLTSFFNNEINMTTEFSAGNLSGELVHVLQQVAIGLSSEDSWAHIYLSFQDITPLRQAEQKLHEAQSMLVHSEKMNALGQMVAGVAHEINNPVAFVNSNLHSLNTALADVFTAYEQLERIVKEDGNPDQLAKAQQIRDKGDIDFIIEDTEDLLTQSIHGLDRVTQIVKGLRTFSRLDEAELKVTNLSEDIRSTLAIAQGYLQQRVTVDLDIDNLPDMACYPAELNQVFLNLIINGAQAIENAGTIKIYGYDQPDHVVLTFTDTGCGMSKETTKHIFDPFFTTKPVGEGTGLGLSIVHSIIVDHHQGQIEVDSTLGEGTTFTITLPKELSHVS